MKKLKWKIAYDGSDFLGFSKTKEGASVEECLEKAYCKLNQEEVMLLGASRTDRGVHATGQIIFSYGVCRFLLDELQKRLNCILPDTIRVLEIEEVEEDFHPSLDAKGKEYCYQITKATSPFTKEYTWHVDGPLDLKKMEEAAKILLGKQDFSALANRACDEREDPICTLNEIALETSGNLIQVKIIGDRFLYKMVRNIVGLLTYVGLGKISLPALLPILESKSRDHDGITAPAKGLFLVKVFY